ncbi:MAG: hypothetical protein AB7C98_07680 [Acidithiobacillus sp.]
MKLLSIPILSLFALLSGCAGTGGFGGGPVALSSCEQVNSGDPNGYFPYWKDTGPRNGLNDCHFPSSCKTWHCPKRFPSDFYASYQPCCEQQKAQNDRAKKYQSAVENYYSDSSKDPLSGLQPATLTLSRKGKVVASGSVEQVMPKVRRGDSIEAGEGSLDLAAFTKNIPDSVSLRGEGLKTVLFTRSMVNVPSKGLLLENLLIKTKNLAFGNREDGGTPNILLNVTLFGYQFVPEYGRLKWKPDTRDIARKFGIWNNVIMIGGSFGVQSPEAIQTLPELAFGTHAVTLSEYGDSFDMYAAPDWLPEGELKAFLKGLSRKSRSTTLESRLKPVSVNMLADLKTDTLQSLLKTRPVKGMPGAQVMALTSLNDWLGKASGGLNIQMSDEDRKIAEVIETDMNNKRIFTALARIASLDDKQARLKAGMAGNILALKRDLANRYTCRASYEDDPAKRGEQTSRLGPPNEVFSNGITNRLVYDFVQLVPAAAYGTEVKANAGDFDCEYFIKIGLNDFTVGKTVRNAYLANTEWWISAQGQAKKNQALSQGLTSMGNSFDAAGRSMESTWKNFEEYRSRTVTTQTGDQYLKSYKGDRNAMNKNTFAELDALRRSAPTTGGPGAPGDYYPVHTYKITAMQSFTHQLQYEVKPKFNGKAARWDHYRNLYEQWSNGPCEDSFIDNGSTVRSGGTTCFIHAGNRVIGMAYEDLKKDFAKFLEAHLLKQIAAENLQRSKSKAIADQAEAILARFANQETVSGDEWRTVSKALGVTLDATRAKALLESIKQL